MLARIIIDWDDNTDLVHQTPGRTGIWQDIKFTLDPIEKCDYAIVCNRVVEKTTLLVPPDNVWQVSMEPPISNYHYYRSSFRQFRRVFTQDMTLRGNRYIHSHGALPWHVGLSYDRLTRQNIADKVGNLSWITSNLNLLPGHSKRLRLLKKMEGRIDFALWGRGFRPLEKKWDGLSPFRYSLAIENTGAEHYWTEKIADCYLSWTMPIYWGAPNITTYFPAESMAQIDISDPDLAVKQIEEIITSDRFERNIDAIAYARNLVLNSYQFFPFVANQIHGGNPTSNNIVARKLILTPPTHPKYIQILNMLRTKLVRLRTTLQHYSTRVSIAL